MYSIGRPASRYSSDQRLREGMRIVGGIVQHLDLQQVAGIIDLGGFLQQAFHHEALIVNRELDGDARQFGKAHGRLAGELACDASCSRG